MAGPSASNFNTSVMVVTVPSIFDDSTASCVASGESRTFGLGTAFSVPSYLASAALAGPINGISAFQSNSAGGNLP